MKIHAFTRKYNNPGRTLTLTVKLALEGTDVYYETSGIIDTGATGCLTRQCTRRVRGSRSATGAKPFAGDIKGATFSSIVFQMFYKKPQNNP
jgi:hypothetical protein